MSYVTRLAWQAVEHACGHFETRLMALRLDIARAGNPCSQCNAQGRPLVTSYPDLISAQTAANDQNSERAPYHCQECGGDTRLQPTTGGFRCSPDGHYLPLTRISSKPVTAAQAFEDQHGHVLPELATAFADWREGRAYWVQNERSFRAGRPNPGHYHLYLAGRHRGPIAPWNAAAKAAYPSVDAFHHAAQS